MPCLQADVSKRVWECYDALRDIEDLEAGLGVLGAFVQRWVDNVQPENRSDVRACWPACMSACFAVFLIMMATPFMRRACDYWTSSRRL